MSELAVPIPWQNPVTRPSRLLPDLAAEHLPVAGDDVRVAELIGRVVPGSRAQLGGALTMFPMSCAVGRPLPSTAGITSSSAPSARMSWIRSSLKQSEMTIRAG